MSNVVRIRRKEKEQEKTQLLSLITMDEFLLSKQKDDIVAEVNSILMDESRAFFLAQCPIVRPISSEKIELRKFYYYRLDRTHLIADIQVRVRAPRCHVTFYYSILCTMDEDFYFGTYGFWLDKPERDELPLDKYLVPYLGWDNIEAETEIIWHRRLQAVFSEPRWLKAYHLANRMGLTIIQRRLPKTRIRSVVFFQEKTIEVEDDHKQIVEENIPAGTIILNMKVIRNDNSGIDIYHECIHWEWHYMFFLLQEMHCTDMGTVKTVETDTSEADDADARHTIWGIEWQARQGSCRLMLPERLARPWIMEAYANVTDKYEREASKYQDIAFSIGREHCIPYSRVRGRMIQLGYWEAKGAVNWVDGRYITPFDFDRESCRKGKTFVIDRKHAKELYIRDENFREILKNGDYVFADGHFVLNDERYVQPTRHGAMLTEEALAALDKCCLLFDLIWSVDDEEFELGCLYSSEEYNRYYFMCIDPECKHTKAENTLVVSKIVRCLAGCTVPEALTYLMDGALARTYTPQELEEISWVSARTIRKYMMGEQREYDVDILIALCVGMHLNPRISNKFLEIAGKNIDTLPNAGTYDYVIHALFMDDMEKIQEQLAENHMDQIKVKERKERRLA